MFELSFNEILLAIIVAVILIKPQEWQPIIKGFINSLQAIKQEYNNIRTYMFNNLAFLEEAGLNPNNLYVDNTKTNQQDNLNNTDNTSQLTHIEHTQIMNDISPTLPKYIMGKDNQWYLVHNEHVTHTPEHVYINND